MSFDRNIIEQYETGGEKLARAIAGMDLPDLMAIPIPGKWSTQQVVIHLADAESAFADRIRRIIAQDDPQLLAWDENRFSARLHYEKQSAADAVELVRLTRRQIGRILRALGAGDFERAGLHSERGRQTLADVITAANGHLDHHLKFIHEKRGRLGKPAKDQ